MLFSPGKFSFSSSLWHPQAMVTGKLVGILDKGLHEFHLQQLVRPILDVLAVLTFAGIFSFLLSGWDTSLVATRIIYSLSEI